MIPLLHQKIQRLAELLNDGSGALRAYAEGTSDFEQKTVAWLEKSRQYYTEAEQPDQVTRVSSCQADVATLNRGYHPQTFLKIERERRTTRNTQIYRSTQQLLGMLEEDYDKVDSRLETAQELVRQLVLNVLQMQIVDEETLRNRAGQEDLEAIWKTIGQDSTLSLFQKKIILNCSLPDAIILLDKVLSQIF
jgi:hypothetical protein